MSPLKRHIVCVILVVFAVAAACSKSRDDNIFLPGVGHPEGWISDHGRASLAQGSNCTECHGEDLLGGVSQVSCSSVDVNGTRCHGSGPGTGHPDGWSAANRHGGSAKARPGAGTGFETCKQCHGDDYGGGITSIPCSECHGVAAPHPKRPWLRSPNTHTSTNRQNAAVCADCHRQRPGSVDCFNNRLCHGPRNVHPGSWSEPGQHGAEAKNNPGRGGFAECSRCHGRDFNGGEADISCFPCHGIPAPHPARGWLGGGSNHRSTGEGNAEVCADCHRERGGIPGCFNSTLCHGSSPHSGGWAAPGAHGATAKEAPSADSGFAYCSTAECHGPLFGGGRQGDDCFRCHTIAPHPDPPWRNGLTHTATDQGNINVCNRCHSSQLGTPPDCFAGNGCHPF